MIHRTRKITFRLTEEEYSIIKRKVNEAGISQQQFLLKMALAKEIIHIKEYQSVMFQIKKIGANINQIARHANQTGVVSDMELVEIKKELELIWQLLKR